MATKLEISELDFDGIKANLKNFLSQQDEFRDYDFEGSGMAVLLDMLAYNTHYLRSEEHTSELQSRLHLVCRLLLEKKKKKEDRSSPTSTMH